MRVRERGWRPIGASISPPAATRPCTSARYSRFTVRAASWRTRAVCASGVLATTSRPERVLVETMDDPGARDAGERGSMVDERVSERAVEVPGARMNDQARRFVDHDDRVVLVHDRERERLGPVAGVARGRGRVQRDALAAPHLALDVAARGVHGDPPLAHPALETAPRVLREHPGERLIEPQAGELARYCALGRRAIIFARDLPPRRHDPPLHTHRD